MSRRECHETQRLISDRFDSLLPEEVQRHIRVHIGECAECAAFERTLQSMAAGLRASSPVTGNPAVRDHVLAAAYRDLTGWPAGWRGLVQHGMRLAGAGIAIALVAVILIAVFGSMAQRDDHGGAGGFGSDTSQWDEEVSAAATPTVELHEGRNNEQTLVATPTVALHQEAVKGEATSSMNPAACRVVNATVTAEAADNSVSVRIHVGTAVEGDDCYPIVHIAITDEDGNMVVGGDRTEPINVSKQLENEAGITFLWTNWCGSEPELAITVTSGVYETRMWPDVLPTCVSVDEPSILTVAEP